jgi:hypothetical protein
MLEAEKQFRKVIGYTQLPQLAVAIERRPHLHQPNPTTAQEAAIAVTMCNQSTPGSPPPKFHGERGNLPGRSDSCLLDQGADLGFRRVVQRGEGPRDRVHAGAF